MTPPPPVYGQFGQALGLAERTLSANLRAHLAERDTEPETWYALQLIATRGPGLAREKQGMGRLRRCCIADQKRDEEAGR